MYRRGLQSLLSEYESVIREVHRSVSYHEFSSVSERFIDLCHTMSSALYQRGTQIFLLSLFIRGFHKYASNY